MSHFFYILTHILMPIFLVIGVAYSIQKKFKLNIATLVKFHIYAILPSLMFSNVYFNELSGQMLFTIAGFVVAMFMILMALATVIYRILGLDRPKGKALVNGIALTNMGNYGLPLFTLLYAGPRVDEAISIQLTVVLTTALLINTIGLYNASSGSFTGRQALMNVFRIPLIYVIVLGFLMKAFAVPLWEPIVSMIDIMKVGVVPMALFILGAQLAETKISQISPLVFMANGIKLLLSPMIAFALVKLLGLSGMLAQMLIISAAFPSAVNSVILAIEFNGDKEFASQTVLFSTILSGITVTVIIGLVTQYIR